MKQLIFFAYSIIIICAIKYSGKFDELIEKEKKISQFSSNYLFVYIEYYLIIAAGGVYSTNTNENYYHSVGGYYNNRNKKGNVETDFSLDGNSKASFGQIFYKERAQVKLEKQGYLPVPGDLAAEVQMIEDSRSQRIGNHVGSDNVASDQIYQHGSGGNPFKNVRFSEGENNKKKL